MSTSARIIDGPLPAPGLNTPPAGTGAMLMFEGIVRELESGRRIAALDYEAYEPMAARELERLAVETLNRHRLLSVRAWHSRGRVPVGACSFRLVIESPHRAEALRAMEHFIDRMKRDVPIWKKPVWADEAEINRPAGA